MFVARSYGLSSRIVAPIYGASADISKGALLMPGTTAETDDGVLINGTATGVDYVGILLELHDYSVVGDALVAGTSDWFGFPDSPSQEVALVDTAVLCEVAYDTADTVGVTSVSGTTTTITSLEDNIDTGFLYAVAGTGLGQLEFIATSAAGSCVMQTAFATALDSTTTVIKILPLFHNVLKWDVATTTDATKIGTDAAAGTGTAAIMERYIHRGGVARLLDPHIHGGLVGLNSDSSFKITALVALQNTLFHPID